MLLGVLMLVVLLPASFGCTSEPSVKTFTGTVESTEVDLGAEIGGRVASVLVEEGDKVAAGQVVVTMDTTTLALQLEQALANVKTSEAKLMEAESGATSNEIEQARAEVKAAEAALEGAEKAMDSAKAQLDRIISLHETGIASDKELDDAQAAFDQEQSAVKTAKANLDAASARLKLLQSGTKEETIRVLRTNVEQAQKAAQLAQANLDKAKILAPVSGIASSVNVEKGEIVNQGASLVTILDLDNLWVEVYVPEKYLDRVNVGDQAMISITAVPGREFKGKVTFIASEAEFTPEKANTEEERADTVFKVRVKILEELAKFKPGMSAEVAFPRINEASK